MISLTPILHRLLPKPADFGRVWFRSVEGVADLAQAMAAGTSLPACWIVRTVERARHAGERAEDVAFAFEVVIAVSNERVHAEGETDDLMLGYRLAVRDRLLGWMLAPEVKPIKYTGGKLVQFSAGELYWADQYEFNALITHYLPDPPAFGELVHAGETL